MGLRRKFSSTLLAIQTTRTLSIPKTDTKLNSNQKLSLFHETHMGALVEKKQKWNIKEGREVFTIQRNNQWTQKYRQKRLPLSKETKLSTLQGMCFLGEKEKSKKRAFAFVFKIF